MIDNLYAMTAPQQGADARPGSAFGGLIPIIAIFFIFWFLLIRPQQKRTKEHQQALNALKKGDRVITSGGMHGRITVIKGQEVEVKIADNVKATFSKSAISTIIKESETESSN